MKRTVQVTILRGARNLNALAAERCHKMVITSIENVFVTEPGTKERKKAVKKVTEWSEKEQRARLRAAGCNYKIVKMTI